jgi:predicted transcriptional regulator
MKYYVLPLFILLGGCNAGSVVTSTRYQVIVPDNSMYNCPTIKSFPNADKLSDADVARLILELYKNNQTCKNSIDAIKKFLERSKASIGK